MTTLVLIVIVSVRTFCFPSYTNRLTVTLTGHNQTPTAQYRGGTSPPTFPFALIASVHCPFIRQPNVRVLPASGRTFSRHVCEPIGLTKLLLTPLCHALIARVNRNVPYRPHHCQPLFNGVSVQSAPSPATSLIPSVQCEETFRYGP